MSVTRRVVLQELARLSDAEHRKPTTIAALVSALPPDTDPETVEGHLDALEACELARVDDDGRVRATVTGEELLGIDTDEVVIVDPAPDEVDG